MNLKPVTPSVENHVQGIWDKGLQKSISQEIVFVEQYSPPKDMINEFESRRNELDRLLGNKKLQTLQAFVAPDHDSLRKILSQGFSKGLASSKIPFAVDAGIAIADGGAKNGNRLLLCRISLGREGVDYQVSRGRYYIENLKGAIPSFLVTYGVPGEAISLTPIE
eukprot:TRINITY_DN1185_c0_g1_i1.p1 TRINITY_DN1185_c0_g1~~TRINITY_DN1185_c0_g1_i1.p1  ORF type:complete len:165 (+),score=27.39 TRINITY_DN1185_c0_g1_i1:2-496(+)